jgi:hypothetical protein
MALLAGVAYDPATAVNVVNSGPLTSSLLAMTAVDTTNLRLTFTAPANGTVLVRVRCCTIGSATSPRILLGVIEHAPSAGTVRMRMSPSNMAITSNAGAVNPQEAVGLITGLTPGNSYTYDAAYGVEIVVASTGLAFGGPNDANGVDAYGAFAFEIWETKNLLAGTLYDPSSAATPVATSLKAMTAFDTTNLRLTFTAPASGNVFWRNRTQFHGSATAGNHLLGILESTTVVARCSPITSSPTGSSVNTAAMVLEGTGIITGVSAGSHTYDAAYGVQIVAGASGDFKYGGPNDTTTNNAWGGNAFELWSA